MMYSTLVFRALFWHVWLTDWYLSLCKNLQLLDWGFTLEIHNFRYVLAVI